jgi:transposase-like protein
MTLQNRNDNFRFCPSCRSHRTRVIGTTITPPSVRYRCEPCGHVYVDATDEYETMKLVSRWSDR